MKNMTTILVLIFILLIYFLVKKFEISFELVKDGNERSILMFYTIKSRYKGVRERDYIIIFKYTTE